MLAIGGGTGLLMQAVLEEGKRRTRRLCHLPLQVAIW